MTLNELRAEAAKLGYKLVRAQNQEYVKLEHCPACGRKRTEEWIDCSGPDRTYFRRCQHCGFDGYWGKTPREARLAWNEAVKTYMKNKAVSWIYGSSKEETSNGSCKKM